MHSQHDEVIPLDKRAAWSRILLSMTLALSLLWSVPALAAPQTQDDEPTPLMLGQLASGDLAEGESAFFTFDAPDDTLYVITTGDVDEAEKFDLIVTDEAGEVVVDEIFETIEVELDDGLHTIELLAVEDGTYSLFVTAQRGDLTDNSSRPGDLYAGSFYSVEDLGTDALYATVEIEETSYWQQGFIVLTGGEGEDFSATIADASFDLYESISSNLEEGPLTFFTQGGEYDLTVTPADDGSSLHVLILMSGPAPTIAVGETVNGSVSHPGGESFHVFTPSESGRLVTVTLESTNDETDLDLEVSATPGERTYNSAAFGPNESITFIASGTEPLFVRVYAFDTSEMDVPVEFTLTVEEGDTAPTLVPGEAVWGTVEAGSSSIFLIPETPANSYVTFILNGDPQIDLDLRAQATGADGTSLASLSSANLGSNEIAMDYIEDAASWQVEVTGQYADEDAAFVLLVRLEPVGVAGAQWAISATASSEYGTDSYSATQATGEPNVPLPSDNSLAWTPSETEGTIETLDLTYERAVVPTGVVVHESFGAGSTISIEAYDEANDEWVLLWEGNEPTEEPSRVFAPEISVPDFATDTIRVTLDTDLVAGWNEIDAVQLFGYPVVE